MSTRLDSFTPACRQVAWCHLGQQGFLLKFGATLVAVDPYLSPRPNRHVPPQLFPEQYGDLAIVTGSHDHSDHIDRKTWPAIAAANPDTVFVVPAEVLASVAADTGIPTSRFVGLDDGQSVSICGITIHAIAAAHEFLDRNPQTGRYPHLSYVFEANGVRIFHAGDTCLYEGFAQKLRRFLPLDMAMLPINGRDAARYNRNCIGNMTFQEAADLAGLLAPRLTIPAHFDMFPGNTEDPRRFTDYLAAKYPALRTEVPVPGVPHLYTAPPDDDNAAATPWQLGITSLIYHQRGFFRALQDIAAIGYTNVELNCVRMYYGHFNAIQLADDPELLTAIASALAVNHLRCSAVDVHGLCQGARDGMDYTERYTAAGIRIADFLHAPVVITSFPNGDATWEERVTITRRLAQNAREHGIQFAVEAEGGFVVSNSTTMRKFIDDVGDGLVKVNYDPSHYVTAGEDPIAVLRKFKGEIAHVHLKEVTNGKPDAYTGAPGSVASRVLAELASWPYRGVISAETLADICDEPETMARTIFQAMQATLTARP